MQNPEKAYTGFCIDKRGNDALFLIPELDMQTTLAGCSDIKLNDEIILKSSKVDVTTQNVIFMRAGVAGGV